MLVEDDDDDDDDYDDDDNTSTATKYITQEVLSTYMNEYKSIIETKLKQKYPFHPRMNVPLTEDQINDLLDKYELELANVMKSTWDELSGTFEDLMMDVGEYNTMLEEFQLSYDNDQDEEEEEEKDALDDDEEGDEDGGNCVSRKNVEIWMKRGLECVIRLDMHVQNAMHRIVQEEYGDDSEEYETILETLDDNFYSLQQQQKAHDDAIRSENENYNHGVKGKKTLNQFLNKPIVPHIIKVIDESVEMIAGYSDGLDRAIDFVAAFSERNTDSDSGFNSHHEEGSVGTTIENGLHYLLGQVELPHQIEDMKEKAGILLHY
mmetsp:Transcript_4600/g.5156  ORF Transcript_4600/g.5156 Transcript_4600/m.5156 type:complete len:320 (+) Transcript_4600:665-1624(+)